jgi:hypothetical protein
MVHEIYFKPPSLLNKYKRLKDSTTEDKALFDSLTNALSEIEIDPSNAIHVPRDRIPKKYKKKHPLMRDCWKYDLPNGWRLIYYIANDGKHRYVVIVGWMTHDEYISDFNY